MRLKEKNLLKKFAATLKKFSAQGAKKVEYGMVVQVGLDKCQFCLNECSTAVSFSFCEHSLTFDPDHDPDIGHGELKSYM